MPRPALSDPSIPGLSGPMPRCGGSGRVPAPVEVRWRRNSTASTNPQRCATMTKSMGLQLRCQWKQHRRGTGEVHGRRLVRARGPRMVPGRLQDRHALPGGDPNEVCVHYYGAYSVRRRTRWRNLGILTQTPPSPRTQRFRTPQRPASATTAPRGRPRAIVKHRRHVGLDPSALPEHDLGGDTSRASPLDRLPRLTAALPSCSRRSHADGSGRSVPDSPSSLDSRPALKPGTTRVLCCCRTPPAKQSLGPGPLRRGRENGARRTPVRAGLETGSPAPASPRHP